MKLLEIYIYGYGKLENVHIANLDNLTVFFGENEAGKSTLMSFIHSILFGFPTKQQTELRYEPKSGAKYGGKIIAHFPQKGKAVIERVKGRATGDVTVHLEDGTVGSDELLQQLLGNLDKTFFQSIFSFNLHGLQNVHQLKGEDIGRFLFSTGTFGSGLLLQVEEGLKKELYDRFKPSGKKPLINEKLAIVKDSYEQLKQQEQRNLQYVTLIKEKQELQDKILELKSLWQLLHNKQVKLEEWKRLSPVVKERNYLINLLGNEEIDFPQDGIDRLNQLNQLIRPLEGQEQALIEKEAKIKDLLETTEPNQAVLKEEYIFNQLGEKLALIKIIEGELLEGKNKLEQINIELQELKEKLHLSLTEEQVLSVDTSMFLEKEIEEGVKKLVRLKDKQEELEDQLLKEKTTLEKIEEQRISIQKNLLSIDEKQRLIEKLEQLKGKETIEKDLQLLRDKRDLLLLSIKREKKEQKRSKLQQGLFGFMFLLLLSYGLLQNEWMFMAIGAIGVVFVLFLYWQKGKGYNDEWNKELAKIEDMQKSLDEQLVQASSSETPWLKEKMIRNETFEKELQLLEIKWEQQNTQYEDSIHAFEIWELEFYQHEKHLQQIREKLLLPENIALDYLHSAFKIMTHMKESLRKKYQLEKDISGKEEKLFQLRGEIISLHTRHSSNRHQDSIEEMVFFLKELLIKEKKKLHQFEIYEEKLSEVREELVENKKKLTHLQNERENLYLLCGVNTEEDFRSLGQRYKDWHEKQLKMEELTKQISLSSINGDEIEQFLLIDNVDGEMEQILERLRTLSEEEESVHQRLAEMNYQISLIEEGGSYAHRLHSYKQLQSVLEEEAYTWAKLSLAKEVLRRTVDRFQNVRLPNLLRMAEQYLEHLTEGNYIRMMIQEETGTFLIERKDHTFFAGNELSQATMEQVYVSLRIALVATLYKRFALPVIIDDSFVNFDERRTRRVMEILRHINGNQILFFTCHKHLLTYFREEEIIYLNEKVDSESMV